MKLNKQFKGVPDGEIYPVEYQPGDECPPELEAGARSLGALDEGTGSGKPSDGLKVEDIKVALQAKGIAIPDGVTLKADLAALLDEAA